MKRAIISLVCCGQLIFAQDAAQDTANVSIAPVRPAGNILIRPYSPATIPAAALGNTPRLHSLIRDGKLYLSPQDAVTLALENNIDIEIARYTPLILAWNLKRAQAGGALPGVPSAASQANSVTNGQGVLGSQAAAGVSGGGNTSSAGTNSSNATISQIGPVTQTLDPTLQETSTFAHRTALQANATQSRTIALAQDSRNQSASLQQGFLSGGLASVTFKDSYLRESAPTDLLNPSVAQSLSVQYQQNLLQGFGVAVNARTITVAKRNLETSDLNFRTTVSNVIANVLVAYGELAANAENVKAKTAALDTANRFLAENQKRLDLGELAPIDIVSSRNQLASSRLDLVNAQSSLEQSELQLKNLISRNGIADADLAGVSIVPSVPLAMPAADTLAPLADLIKKAVADRSDLRAEQVSLENTAVNDLGTRNGLLPTVTAFVSASNSGLAGEGHTVNGQSPDPYFIGGAGTALAQVLRRNFPSESIGAFARVPIGNRQAQADFAIDQLQYRQQQLTTGKDRNQAAVDVSNAVVALQQERARWEAAHANVELVNQLLAGEQQKFSVGESTSFNVISQQRDLAAAQASELSALVAWYGARINLDAMTGDILASNGVTLK